MALKELIDNDIKTALLSGRRFEGETLRGLKAAILNEEVAQNRRDTGLEDLEIEAIIAREVKKRRESIALYSANGRPELAQAEQDEVEIIERYLPEQMSEADLGKIIDAKIIDLGASGPKDMGQVISAVKKEVGNAADGATVARLVKQSLL